MVHHRGNGDHPDRHSLYSVKGLIYMTAKTNEEMVDKVTIDPVSGNTVSIFSKLRGNIINDSNRKQGNDLRPMGGSGTNPV
jgi:hypothetical protein